MLNKVIPASDAVALIQSGDSVCTSGFVGIGVPEDLLCALESRFIETARPTDLTLMFAAGQGDGKERGLNHLAHDGLLKKVVGGHWGLIPKVADLALSGLIEAYNLPQGVISQLYREIAANRPGLITSVGLGTFVDPRNEGGKIGSATVSDIVSVVRLQESEYLFYPSINLSVALLRGSTADERGNITMEREALVLDALAMAMAVRNCGGIVIVQVEHLVKTGSLNAREVILPSTLVDAVVVSEKVNHPQTFATGFSPYFANNLKSPLKKQKEFPLSVRKVIARRCAMELSVDTVINLGIGMPEGVASVAAEEGIIDYVTLTTEPGVIGGIPASGLDFGAAVNTDAIIAQNQQFDFYDGGGLHMACLGMAQVDRKGDVNVSRFSSRLTGAGGFINISQNARKLVYCGTFTAGGLNVELSDGRLKIKSEGRVQKFLPKVEQITYNAELGLESNQPVIYVTERAVFELTEQGVKLIEVAPGIDIEQDILNQMGFEPIIDDIKDMNSAIFQDEKMGLLGRVLDLKVIQRVDWDSKREILFLNFEDMSIRNTGDIDEIRRSIEEKLKNIDRKVDVVVNYDRFDLHADVAQEYSQMVEYLEKRYYQKVSRMQKTDFSV